MNIRYSHAVLILLSTSLIVWYMHFREIDVPKMQERSELHSLIVERSAPSPYQYRILLPYMAEAMSRVFEAVTSKERAVLAAYGILEAAAVIALTLVLFRYFLIFFDLLPALVGCLFVNLSMVVALRDHYFQPWSLVNALAFALAALLLCRRRWIVFGVTVFVSAFNRETSILIPFLYLFTCMKRENWANHLMRWIIFCAVWCGGYLIVRAVQGEAVPLQTLSGILEKNLAPKFLFYMVMNGALFLGVFWVFAVKGFKTSPGFVKRLALYIPFYLAGILIYGVWKEVRLLMPLYPVLIPMALSCLFPFREDFSEF